MCEDKELSDYQYLIDLAERLFKIPATYNVDQYDYSRLKQIAEEIEKDCTRCSS